MNTKFLLTSVVAVMLTVPAQAAVTVNFVKPESYIDVPFDHAERQQTIDELNRHFEKLGRKLPAGQDLTIDVLDIDLAGTVEFNRRAGRDFRILRGGADWPMIEVKYSLSAADKVLKSGAARVRNLNYTGQFSRYSLTESLGYEKRMLDEWFKNELLTP